MSCSLVLTTQQFIRLSVELQPIKADLHGDVATWHCRGGIRLHHDPLAPVGSQFSLSVESNQEISSR